MVEQSGWPENGAQHYDHLATEQPDAPNSWVNDGEILLGGYLGIGDTYIKYRY